MRSQAVLVIGNRLAARLHDTLFEGGVAVVSKRQLAEALAHVRRRTCDAIVIDGADGEHDVLELVLNIRDLDAQVPVVVWAVPAERPEITSLLKQLEVECVRGELPAAHLAAKVDALVAGRPARSETGRV